MARCAQGVGSAAPERASFVTRVPKADGLREQSTQSGLSDLREADAQIAGLQNTNGCRESNPREAPRSASQIKHLQTTAVLHVMSV
jgi:hypothetical protein